MQNYQFSYDKENDDLLLFNPNSKSKGSVELGPLVLDYNSKKELVGIQILKASSVIKDIIKDDLITIKDILSTLKECKIETKNKGSLMIIQMYLISSNKEISPVLTMPSIKTSSPSIAYT